jgi:4-aminobutyrate aminotransferase-like enzyme
MGNVLTLTPPLTITEAQMLQGIDIIAAAIEDACQGARKAC